MVSHTSYSFQEPRFDGIFCFSSLCSDCMTFGATNMSRWVFKVSSPQQQACIFPDEPLRDVIKQAFKVIGNPRSDCLMGEGKTFLWIECDLVCRYASQPRGAWDFTCGSEYQLASPSWSGWTKQSTYWVGQASSPETIQAFQECASPGLLYTQHSRKEMWGGNTFFFF